MSQVGPAITRIGALVYAAEGTRIDRIRLVRAVGKRLNHAPKWPSRLFPFDETVGLNRDGAQQNEQNDKKCIVRLF